MSDTSCTSPAFLTRFRCLGDKCEDTCCKGWKMQVDPLTLERYSADAPQLLNSVVQEEGGSVMKRDARTDYCVRFDGGLCSIQSTYGENFLGDACALYPRVPRKLGEGFVLSAAPSCPEIVRLAFAQPDGFAWTAMEAHRPVAGLQNLLPEGLSESQALGIHSAFLAAVLEENVSAERSLMRIVMAAQSLSRISPGAWPDAVPFYLAHADASMPAPDKRDTDPVYLLQSLCGLIAAAKQAHNARLMQTVNDMESALHAGIRMETLAIAALPDHDYAAKTMRERWEKEWQGHYAPMLRRYVAMELSLALFPFAGFGNTLGERAAIIAIRLATVKLALMSVCSACGGIAPETETVRVIQSLSRFIDHLAEPEFSLRIYAETGWLQPARLRALLRDN